MSFECFTENQKTILSIDFDRPGTCIQICDYCYVENMERIYPAYLAKIKRNSDFMKTKQGQIDFAERLNKEYEKARKSKSKTLERLDRIPVRVYGSGDFIVEHFEVLKRLNFKFFVISKNVTTTNLRPYIDRLLALKNLTTLCLSFDNQNMRTYKDVKHYFKQNKIRFMFTGLPDSFQSWKNLGLQFDVFFNIKKTKEEKDKAKNFKERCPADVGEMKLQKACTYCNKCWRSTVTKTPDWNLSFQA